MHIAIPLHDWNGGGTERVAMALATEWLRTGDKVTLLVGHDHGPARAWAPPGAAIVALPTAIPRSPTSRLHLGPAMRPLVAALEPDAIFLPGNFHLILARALAGTARIVGKLSNPLWPYRGGTLLARPLFRAWTRGITAFAAMNSGLAADTRALLGDVEIATIPDPLIVARAATPTPPDPDRFITIGRLEPQKDMALALRTLAALRRHRPDARLEIAGTGPDLPALQSLASSLGLPVRFAGQVEPITPFLDGAAALLITSRYEGGPAVAVEALARGVPVISTDCSAMLRDLLTRPEQGAIVPTRDPQALASALAAQTLRPDPQDPALDAWHPQNAAAAYRALLAG
ncbi:glycosyltransferase [Sandaracinobacteroides saxicola]|uniref:Glycosyltransferase n=1 Tax=Sandaracinobacteroides saxicola TaxID=2759707 RepID=A0A7G5IHV5_9SPHN|nr:glycosyltransferase [Sandaracinobacteroides saxicola]QMW22947.1 glycosyltransferase [Sandaracinobacteroides saxicola]